jgi:hypothetical protein
VTCGHVWARYKNVFEKMKLRGVSKEPLSSPKSFGFLLREMKSFSQTLSGSQDRSMAQEKSILKIVTCNF